MNTAAQKSALAILATLVVISTTQGAQDASSPTNNTDSSGTTVISTPPPFETIEPTSRTDEERNSFSDAVIDELPPPTLDAPFPRSSPAPRSAPIADPRPRSLQPTRPYYGGESSPLDRTPYEPFGFERPVRPNNITDIDTHGDHSGCSHDHDALTSPVGRIQEPRGFPDRRFRDRTDLLFDNSIPRRTSPTDPRECPYRFRPGTATSLQSRFANPFSRPAPLYRRTPYSPVSYTHLTLPTKA